MARRAETEKVLLQKIASGNSVDYHRRVLFGVKYTFTATLKNSEPYDSSFKIEIRNAKLKPNELYYKDNLSEQAHVNLKAG